MPSALSVTESIMHRNCTGLPRKWKYTTYKAEGALSPHLTMCRPECWTHPHTLSWPWPWEKQLELDVKTSCPLSLPAAYAWPGWALCGFFTFIMYTWTWSNSQSMFSGKICTWNLPHQAQGSGPNGPLCDNLQLENLKNETGWGDVTACVVCICGQI